MATNEIQQNGWTAVPVDPSKIFKRGPYIHKPEALLAKDIQFPSNEPIVRQVQEYVKNHLPRETYNHSMRVFYYCRSPPCAVPLFNPPPNSTHP